MGDPGDGMGAPSVGPSNLTPGPGTRNVPVQTPTGFGHALTLLSGGTYDPSEGMGGASPTGRITKFGALTKLLQPAMQGAAVGGFLGRSTPEGGFGAANQFFMQRRMMDMQRQQFFLNQLKMQSEVAKNQAETQWTQRRPLVSRTAPAIKGVDDSGNPIYMTQDPNTGTFVRQEGIRPEDATTYKEIETEDEAGKPTYGAWNPKNPRAGVIPMTLARSAAASVNSGDAESASAPSRVAGSVPPGMFVGSEGGVQSPPTGGKPGTQFNSGSPRVAGAASQSPGAISAMVSSGVPTRPPGYGQPKPTIRSSRNAAGVETDNVVDTNPNSPTFGKTIQKTGVTRQPVPDRAADRAGKKDAVSGAIEDHVDAVMQMTGNDPDAAVAAITADKKVPAQYKPLMRNRIRELTKRNSPPETKEESLKNMLNLLPDGPR
jgi:hypothetical protein